MKPIRNLNKDNEGSSFVSDFSVNYMGVETPYHEHDYEIFPYIHNGIVSMNGEIIDRQSYTKESNTYKVIYDGNKTIVILKDGTRGIAKRDPKDRYDKFLGEKIAHKRANIKSLNKELKKLIRQVS